MLGSVSSEPVDSVATLQLNDIQALLLDAFDDFGCAFALGVTLAGSKPNVWLRALLPQVRHAGEVFPVGSAEKPFDALLQIAFTPSGLTQLGVDAHGLAPFSKAFREGCEAGTRTLALGDVGASAPEHWQFGDARERRPRLDVWLLGYARDPQARDALRQRIQALNEAHGQLAAFELPLEDLRGHEHFGFREGIAQPKVRGLHRGARTVAAGEFVFGYPDAYGEYRLAAPRAPDSAWLRGGSYLVARMLQQDVHAFWRYLDEQAAGDPAERERLAAKLIGRWRNGTPVVLSPDAPADELATVDEFGFDADRDGVRCPLGAHVRRANPRDWLVGHHAEHSLAISSHHRLLRRGRPYGKPLHVTLDPAAVLRTGADAVARGLLFLCFNTDIDQQFEFVQHSWLANPKFAGLRSDPDPLMFGGRGSEAGPARFTIPGRPLRHQLRNLPDFVRVRGSAYLFFPGLPALRQLAEPNRRTGFHLPARQPAMPPATPVVREERSMSNLPIEFAKTVESIARQFQSRYADAQRGSAAKPLAGTELEIDQLLRYFEEFKYNLIHEPEAVFRLLRRVKPTLVTRNVVVVSRYDDVREVLSAPHIFQAVYGPKMRLLTNGQGFMLGRQYDDEYIAERSMMSTALNRGDLSRIVQIAEAASASALAADGGEFDFVRDLLRPVCTAVINDYFGIPGDAESFTEDLNAVSRYCFADFVDDDELRAAALVGAEGVMARIDAALEQPPAADTVVDRLLLLERGGMPHATRPVLRSMLFGTLTGFTPSVSITAPHALSILLARPTEQAQAHEAACRGDRALLTRFYWEALRFRPLNLGILRTAVEEYTIGRGGLRATRIPQGKTVLASTAAAMFDEGKLVRPHEFRLDRPRHHYLHYGYHVHDCVGAHVADAIIAVMYEAVLKKLRLRAADGASGKLSYIHPFPVSWTLLHGE